MAQHDHENFIVIAQMRARAGREQALREALSALVPLTLREQGCITYALHVDAADPASFFLYEVWRSRQDHSANLETPHLRDFVASTGDLLDGEIRVSFLRGIAPERSKV